MFRNPKKNPLRPSLGKAKGEAKIEFILSFLMLMFVIFWIWEIVMALYTYNVLSDAAKEGVRYAIVHGSGNSNCSGPNTPACPDPSGNNVIAVVKDYAKYSLHDISAMNVTVTYLDPVGNPTDAAPNRVQVQVQYNYVPYISLPWLPPLLKTAAEGRIAY